MSYKFPGNIRELKNIIEYAFILCHSQKIEVEHLPGELPGEPIFSPRSFTANANGNLKQLEEDAIRNAMLQHAGNRGKAALDLGIDKSTLWRKMRKYSIS